MIEERNNGLAGQTSHPEPPGDLIRRAEQMISVGNFGDAIGLLDKAHLQQPENQYILAIRQRAEFLQHASSHQSDSDRIPASPNRYLSITVGKQFAHGIKSQEAHDSDSDAVESRVQRLTLIATRLFERGEFDSAFDSLMKAYLLDPNSPSVIACEKTMMPLWDMMRARGLVASPPQDPPAATASQKKRATPPPSPPKNDEADEQQQTRLKALMQQKEEERKNRERTMWRNASSPPRMVPPPTQQSTPLPPDSSEQPQNKTHGLLRKLKKGKFPG